MKNCIIVPWFSRNEWLEAYEKIFSDEYDDVKYVVNLLHTWSVRVSRLPMGVEATLVLLQARHCIMKEEVKHNPDMKNRILCSAVASFVSTVVKSVENKFFRKRSQHELATIVGLPKYLVNLRNEICHTNNLDPLAHTILKAMQDSLDWIKKNYWDIEHKKMQGTLDTTIVEDDVSNTEEEITELAEICSKFVTRVVRKKSSSNKFKVQRLMMDILTPSVRTNSKNVYLTVVKHLFLPLAQALNNEENPSTHGLDYDDTLTDLQFVFTIIQEQKDETEFICLLIQHVSDADFISKVLERLSSNKLDINKIVKGLLYEENIQLSNLALLIMKRETQIFSQEQIEHVMNLSNLLDIETNKHDDEETSMDISPEHDYEAELIAKIRSAGGSGLPLGIISEEQNYPDFYKELILDI